MKTKSVKSINQWQSVIQTMNARDTELSFSTCEARGENKQKAGLSLQFIYRI